MSETVEVQPFPFRVDVVESDPISLDTELA